MADRKHAPGQKKATANAIIQEESKKHQIGGVPCAPPDACNRRFDEAGLIISDPDTALEKCKKQESSQLVAGIKTEGVRDWVSVPLIYLPCPRENFGNEMAKGDRRYVRSAHVRAQTNLRRQEEIKRAGRAETQLAQWKNLANDDPEKLALIQEALDIIREAKERGNPQQRIF